MLHFDVTPAALDSRSGSGSRSAASQVLEAFPVAGPIGRACALGQNLGLQLEEER